MIATNNSAVNRRRAHLGSTTKVRRKRAPVAELESSANPQPGKAALRSARFPACGFCRLSSRQMVVLSRRAHLGGTDANPMRQGAPQSAEQVQLGTFASLKSLLDHQVVVIELSAWRM